MLIVPDSSILIPYLARHAYADTVERALRARRLVLCSVVAEEVMAGANDQNERRDYDRFFGLVGRVGGVITPDDEMWRTCGRLLSRYRERFGAIKARDHQNDVLIALAARSLAREQETTLLTENDADFRTWLNLAGPHPRVRLEAARR